MRLPEQQLEDVKIPRFLANKDTDSRSTAGGCNESKNLIG